MIDLKYLKDNEIGTGSNPAVVKYIDSLYESTKKIYLKQHKDWYLNDRFVRGDHWIVYNKTMNKIQTIPVAKGEVRRTVNKIRTQLRGVKNFIKRSQPRWEIHPADGTDEAYNDAKNKNKIVQEIYDNSGIKNSLTDVIVNGLKYSTGFIEGGVINDNGKEKISFWIDSSYDILPDPYASKLQDCRYIFKTFVKPVTSVINNSKYKISNENLADNKEAASDYKNVLELEKYNKDTNKGVKDLETCVVKELWIKWQENFETKIRVITIIGENIARVHDPKYRRYPIFSYSPEKNNEAIFSESWIKDLISLNKSLDKTVSQIEAYIQRMLAGKFLIKQGTEVSTITDKGAEKIYYKGSVPPKQMDLPPLPSTPFSFLNSVESWIEELGGVREASLGKSVGSLQSGAGIEALQEADAGTVAEPIENLELFLKEIAEFILELIADYQIASKDLVVNGEKITYISDKAKLDLENVVKINGKEKVRVTIVPEVSYNEETKKNWLMRLAEAGIIDQKTLLEQFNFSNISDIVARMEKNKEEEFKQDMMKQRESHRTDGNGPQDTADLADQENMQMAAGQDVPDTPKVLWTPEHTQLHISFIQENSDAYNQNKELFDAHIRAEETYQ